MISIVMPVYKTDYPIIKRAIRSVVTQSFTDWELYVVDDNNLGTPYFSAVKRIAEEMRDERRIHFIQEGKNRGANVARNVGIIASKGEIITFLDSDDEWEREYLSYVSKFFLKNPDAVLLSSSYQIIWGSKRQNMIHKCKKENIAKAELYGDQMSPTTCVAGRRHVLIEAGMFDETLQARPDYDMWLRACQYGNVGFTNKVFAKIYRDGNGHESISENYKRHIQATEKVLIKILKNNDLSENMRKGIKARQFRYMALAAAKNKDQLLFDKYARKSLLNDDTMENRFLLFVYRHQIVLNTLRWIKHKIN